MKEIVIFRVGLLKKHPCAREVAWSNITPKRCRTPARAIMGTPRTSVNKGPGPH